MLTLLAFVVALALLVAVHEWGHYRVALACGVKVLRFSLGFGPVWWRRVNARGTEFTCCVFPLGGYVRMLDEREGPVPAADAAQAFNRQPLWARGAIVLAGPLANLCLACVLFAGAAWWGLPQARPVLSQPLPGTLAAQAGLGSAWAVERLAAEGEPSQAIVGFEQLQTALVQAALAGRDVTLWGAMDEAGAVEAYRLPFSEWDNTEIDASWWARVGIVVPWSAPVLGAVAPGGAAARAGLLPGDEVLAVDGHPVPDAFLLRHWIRDGINGAPPGQAMLWSIQRAGQGLQITVEPERQQTAPGGAVQGRIGAYLGAPPATSVLREDFWGGWVYGWQRTCDWVEMTGQLFARWFSAGVGWQQLGGPLAIADQAGASAQQGLAHYLVFLATLSVSLGLLNLLPIPMLDGGHLLYYAVEAVCGRPLPERWVAYSQRFGLCLLLLLMGVAMSNDLARWFK